MQIILIIVVILLILGVVSLQFFIPFFINNFILPDSLTFLSVPVIGALLFILYILVKGHL